MGGGTLRPPSTRGSASARVASQRQRMGNMGDWSAAWVSTSSMRSDESISKIDASGKQCCGPSESSTPSSVAAACSSKSKARQKRLRSARPEGAVQAGAEGRVQHELHPARLVEEALGDERLLGGQGREDAERRGEVVDRLAGPGLGSAPSAASQPMAASRSASRGSRSARSRETSAESAALRPGASPSQNGMPGGRAARVLHPHHARLDAPDAPGGVAEQEDVAGHALDGEVLVDRARPPRPSGSATTW